MLGLTLSGNRGFALDRPQTGPTHSVAVIRGNQLGRLIWLRSAEFPGHLVLKNVPGNLLPPGKSKTPAM